MLNLAYDCAINEKNKLNSLVTKPNIRLRQKKKKCKKTNTGLKYLK